MMVVDLLHEFELGVWKALFTHSIRILHAASERPGVLVDILNTRYVSQRRGKHTNAIQIGSVRFLRLVGLLYGVFITTCRR